MNYTEIAHDVHREISEVIDSIDNTSVEAFINIITKPNTRVIGYSAGRMGFGLKAFLMRLNHLGIPAYWLGDNYVPPMHENDVFICCSNSGETKSVVSYANIFKSKSNGTVVSFVGDSDSTIAKLSDLSITFRTCNGGLNSSDNQSKIVSIQPMTSLTEQSMFVIFDIIAVMIINKLQINLSDTKQFHSNIE